MLVESEAVEGTGVCKSDVFLLQSHTKSQMLVIQRKALTSPMYSKQSTEHLWSKEITHRREATSEPSRTRVLRCVPNQGDERAEDGTN
jgi:hypothetical protein